MTTYLIYTRATFRDETHDHRLFAAGHEPEPERGAPLQYDDTRFGRCVIAMMPYRFLIGGGFV